MTRSRDIANDQANLGGAISPFVAGKNYVINGGMDFIQRGAVSSVSGTRYVLDRWASTTGGTYSVSQQSTGAPVGLQYYARMTTNAGGSYVSMYHYVETMNVAPLWGRNVTLTAKVRRNSSFNANIQMALAKSSTVDAGSGATWTSITSTTVANASIPTGTTSSDWYTISFTTTVPADGSANSLRVQFDPSAGTTSGDYWELASVQLELGSIATPFARAGGSIGGELALCQRYYERSVAQGAYGRLGGGGVCANSSLGYMFIPFKVTKRAAVSTTIDTGGTLWCYDGSANPTISSITMDQVGDSGCDIAINGSGFTQYRTIQLLANNSTTAYIGFSAEL